MIKYAIRDLKNKYHLQTESEKKILRYNEIINTYSEIDKNVYTKIELYTNRLNILAKEIEKCENDLLKDIDEIVISINKYVTTDLYSKFFIEVTERYSKLKSLKRIEKTDSEEELSNQIKNLFDKETKTKLKIDSINKKNQKLKCLLNSLLDYKNESTVDKSSIVIVIEQIKNDIKNNEITLLTLNDDFKEIQKKRYKLLEEELLVTTNLSIIEATLINVFYWNENIKVRDFHNYSIPLLKENKKFDKNQFTNGKYFLKKYIENYYPNYLNNYQKYLNHLEALELASRNQK